ncbi:MAG: sugar ABC transporter substrate-binding protein [Chloroflexota bacterium]|nr:sugar ABC transporter substrate-binding protein [Chloroflexota bacterium]
MSRARFFNLVFVLLICSGLTVACTGGGDVVTFMVFGDPAELVAYEALVDAFEAGHPDIGVEMRHIPGQAEYRRRLATDFSAGAPADVMLLNYRRFATFAGQGGLQPVDTYLKQSEVLQESDFFQPTIDAFHLDDQLWCVPQNISSLVAYYNKDLFDQAGLHHPLPDWTWQEFLEAARSLTVDLDGDGTIDQYGAGISPNLFRLAPFVWQYGGQIVDDPENPTRLTLDDPAALAAFQWLVDLRGKEGVVPDSLAESARSSENRFLDGTLAIYFNSRRGVPTYRTIGDFDWDVVALPHGPSQAGILHSDGYCMASSTNDKEAAWKFIEFANSHEGQSIVARSGRTVPSLKSVAESAAFLDPDQPPASSRVYIDTIPLLGRVPIMTTWASIEETASREIERAFYGQATVPEAAEAAVGRTKAYFDEDREEVNK